MKRCPVLRIWTRSILATRNCYPLWCYTYESDLEFCSNFTQAWTARKASQKKHFTIFWQLIFLHLIIICCRNFTTAFFLFAILLLSLVFAFFALYLSLHFSRLFGEKEWKMSESKYKCV